MHSIQRNRPWKAERKRTGPLLGVERGWPLGFGKDVRKRGGGFRKMGIFGGGTRLRLGWSVDFISRGRGGGEFWFLVLE